MKETWEAWIWLSGSHAMRGQKQISATDLWAYLGGLTHSTALDRK